MTTIVEPAWTPVPHGVWLALRTFIEPYVGAAFTIPGDPVPKKRRVGQGQGAFTPKRTVDAENRVREAFREALPGWQPEPDRTYGALVEFHTKSTSKVDIDNGTKLVLDALNTTIEHAGFWQDDIQVGNLFLHLERRGDPGVEVLLFAVEPNGTLQSTLCECGTRYRALERMCRACIRRRAIVNQLLAGDDEAARSADELDRQRRIVMSHLTAHMIGRNTSPSMTSIAARLGASQHRAAAVVDTLIADGYLARNGRNLKIERHLGSAA